MNFKAVIYTIIFLLPFVFNAAAEKSASRNITAINGKLLQATGKPLAYTEIELVLVDADTQINDGRLLATTSVSGLFSFVNVPDGKYTLSINFDEKPSDTSPFPTFFYPNAASRAEAEVFEIDAATKIKNLVFRLPPKLIQRKITGTVVGADGNPVADAFVFLKDLEYDDASFAFNHKTDRNGAFKIHGFENRRYYIAALLLDRLPSVTTPPGKPLAVGRTPIFVLDANIADFKLVLKKIDEEKEKLDNNVGMLILER